ncbi:uncharacterized protein LOC5521823 [Nematostella vectensis]|uniref:uncharacterized protein LOC5521823 n=1 Tax=Nematostella vectensis TaxID=45351 RepID=UPI00138FC0A8|nr:uncharacterized protein LOC5521823 [Nematostella vectensis]
MSLLLDSNFVESKAYELYERNALGHILAQIFEGYGDLYSVPDKCDSRNFALFSLFLKDGRNRFVYVGHLCRNGGVFQDEGMDIRRPLLPHLHCSSTKHIDRYLTAVKYPFSSRILEFTSTALTGRPEGKRFSWLELGTTQINYVDPIKLSAKLSEEACKIDTLKDVFRGKDCVYLVYQVCRSEKLVYYGSRNYQSISWHGKDSNAIESQIKNAAKDPSNPSFSSEIKDAPRAFTFCKMPLARDGTLGKPVYNVALIPTSPREESDLPGQFYAEELDFDFVSWLVSHLKEMKTRELWRPALVDLYTLVDGKDRQQALGFLLTVIKSFQTAEQQAVQMVDLSMAIPSIPLCLAKYPMILSRVLRGAEIVMTDPSPNDSDDESEEPQIVFQPSNSQEYLRLLEFLFHVFAKGVITDQQGEATAALSAKDVAALQELYYTQMGCICKPEKTLNPREEPMASLWKKGTRTRTYLESLGLQERMENDQKVVTSPRNAQLINILTIFFSDVD